MNNGTRNNLTLCYGEKNYTEPSWSSPTTVVSVYFDMEIEHMKCHCVTEYQRTA